MRIALIPPRGMENYALWSNFHLALALPELMKRRTYADMYKRAVSLNDYVVLDNGAAEGRSARPEDLIRYANNMNAHEIVLPDVMFESRYTILAVRAFLENHKIAGPKMAVVQGKEWGEVRSCVKAFDSIKDITAIGIPRHLIGTLRQKAARIDLANWVWSNFGERFEIHFLGTDPSWLGEVRKAQVYAPFVRSLDSSLPFNYAIANKYLQTTNEVIRRPDGYFDLNWRPRVNTNLIRSNIKIFMEWANVEPVNRTEAPSRPVRDVSAV